MLFAIPFPVIDPVALQIGPVAIRWYALAYVFGIIVGWRYARVLAAQKLSPLTPAMLDDFVTWAILGIVLGGRIGYVVFYNADYYLQHPGEALYLWHGGMSFHGGLIGVITAMALFVRTRHIRFFHLTDVVAAVTPIGLFFGRLANFINGELFGRETDLPWGMVFPNGGPNPRHPSQLYEAILEGLILFSVLAVVAWRYKGLARPGLISGIFFIGYALCRIIVEFVREPDQQVGFLVGGATMGQLLSLPMIAFGIAFIWLSRRAKR